MCVIVAIFCDVIAIRSRMLVEWPIFCHGLAGRHSSAELLCTLKAFTPRLQAGTHPRAAQPTRITAPRWQRKGNVLSKMLPLVLSQNSCDFFFLKEISETPLIIYFVHGQRRLSLGDSPRQMMLIQSPSGVCCHILIHQMQSLRPAVSGMRSGQTLLTAGRRTLQCLKIITFLLNLITSINNDNNPFLILFLLHVPE